MSVGCGIVGFGEMAKWHAECVQNLDGLSLHSVFDITPACRAEAADRFGCRPYDNLAAFLDDDDLTLVIVATPSHAHVEPSLAALRAGKHVLVEKPIARTESEAEQMFAAAQTAGRTLMTFQNRRYDSDFLTTRQAVESGKLGRIHDIRFVRWCYSRIIATFGARAYRPGWRTEAAYGGGTLLDFGAHYLDQLLQLVPAPVESVYGELRGRRWTREVDDQFLVVVRFADDLTAVVEFSLSAVPSGVDVTWAISGARGGYRYEKDQGLLYSRNEDDEESVDTIPACPEDWPALYRNLCDVVNAAAEPLVKPRETLRLMRVLDAARRSAETRQVVAVDDVYAPDRCAPGSCQKRN
ncbi:MAG: Gfo/Idh/MocA family oxidoreductase [Planctomycetes bacterium]|nr:Gfo/Idh/MocA family oxidoreductase [Planctomycetota bacterium]